MEAIFSSPWFTLAAGLVGGVFAQPTLISPLLGRLFPSLPKVGPAVLPAADSALVYFKQIVDLLHKVLDQNAARDGTAPPAAPDVAAAVRLELAKLAGPSVIDTRSMPGV